MKLSVNPRRITISKFTRISVLPNICKSAVYISWEVLFFIICYQILLEKLPTVLCYA